MKRSWNDQTTLNFLIIDPPDIRARVDSMEIHKNLAFVRVDIELPRVDYEKLSGDCVGESSEFRDTAYSPAVCPAGLIGVYYPGGFV